MKTGNGNGQKVKSRGSQRKRPAESRRLAARRKNATVLDLRGNAEANEKIGQTVHYREILGEASAALNILREWKEKNFGDATRILTDDYLIDVEERVHPEKLRESYKTITFKIKDIKSIREIFGLKPSKLRAVS